VARRCIAGLVVGVALGLSLPAGAQRTDFDARVHGAPAPTGAGQARPARVVVVYPGVQSSDYWRRSVRAFEARLRALRVEARTEVHFTRPGVELAAQAEALEEGLDGQVDYLVFTLDVPRHRTLAERVLSRGRPKLLLQNVTAPVPAWAPHPPLLYAGFDHHAGGKRIGAWFRAKVGDAGRYAVFHGTRGAVSAERVAGFRAGLGAAPTLRQVEAYYVGFDRETARRAAQDLFDRHPDVDFVYAASTDIALGVLDAARLRGLLGPPAATPGQRRPGVLINGWGGGTAELQALRAGELAVTVMRMTDDASVAMAEAIALDLAGRAAEVPAVYRGEQVLVTRDTPPTELARLAKHAFRYSGSVE
jgi:autoinducer 2-binding protein LuxP